MYQNRVHRIGYLGKNSVPPNETPLASHPLESIEVPFEHLHHRLELRWPFVLAGVPESR